MANKITCFEDLIVWQKAQDIAVKIYKLVEENDFIKKDFSLKDQFKSAAFLFPTISLKDLTTITTPISIVSLGISKGSCGEIRNKIHFARRLKFITEASSRNSYR